TAGRGERQDVDCQRPSSRVRAAIQWMGSLNESPLESVARKLTVSGSPLECWPEKFAAAGSAAAPATPTTASMAAAASPARVTLNSVADPARDLFMDNQMRTSIIASGRQSRIRAGLFGYRDVLDVRHRKDVELEANVRFYSRIVGGELLGVRAFVQADDTNSIDPARLEDRPERHRHPLPE